MPKPIFKDLKKVWVCGQKLQISRAGGNKKNTNFKSAANNKHAAATGSDSRSTHTESDRRSAKHADRNDRDDNQPGTKRRKQRDTNSDHKFSAAKRRDITTYDSGSTDTGDTGHKSAGNKSGGRKGEGRSENRQAFKPARDRKVRKDRGQSDKKGAGKKGRLGLASETQKSLKTKRKRDDSVAINKKRIRSIKARRDAGSGSEYVPDTKVEKSKNKSKSKDKPTELADLKS